LAKFVRPPFPVACLRAVLVRRTAPSGLPVRIAAWPGFGCSGHLQPAYFDRFLPRPSRLPSAGRKPFYYRQIYSQAVVSDFSVFCRRWIFSAAVRCPIAVGRPIALFAGPFVFTVPAGQAPDCSGRPGGKNPAPAPVCSSARRFDNPPVCMPRCPDYRPL
jgi:hypothetical protein